MLTRRQTLASLAALPVSLMAGASPAASPMIYAPGRVAINGYDTVAYFSDAKPVLGKRSQAVMWKGAIWQFRSASNRIKFESDPWAFAPSFGGYCAYGMSIGLASTTSPDAWRIYNNKLFLIHNLKTREIWERDIDGNIARANHNWPAVLRQ
ncbi:MAG: YHS domain protein [Rhodobacteraceae bacterium]|nr:YHS domain protein [Paracoccaceae bacterium]